MELMTVLTNAFISACKDLFTLVIMIAIVIALNYIKKAVNSFCTKNEAREKNETLEKINLITSSAVDFINQTFTSRCRSGNIDGKLTQAEKEEAFNRVKAFLDEFCESNPKCKDVIVENYGNLEEGKSIIIESCVFKSKETAN